MSLSSSFTFDANFTLLQLVQRLAQEDISLAAALIGADQEVVQRISTMTTAEQLTLARSSQPILKLRFNSLDALEAVISPRRSSRLQGLHSSICMASFQRGQERRA